MKNGFAFSPKKSRGEILLKHELMIYYNSMLNENSNPKFLILIPGFIVKAELNLEETDKINANGHVEFNLASAKQNIDQLLDSLRNEIKFTGSQTAIYLKNCTIYQNSITDEIANISQMILFPDQVLGFSPVCETE